MKCISKLNKIINGEHGVTYLEAFFTIIVLLVIGVYIAINFNSQLQAMEIKKSVRMEMNNLSAIIVEDTFNSIKHGSVDEYEEKLKSSSSYRNYLLKTTTDNIASNLGLTQSGDYYIRINDKGDADYTLSDFSLEQQNSSDRIKYIIKFKITLNVKIFGEFKQGFTQDVVYETHHVKNY